MNGYRNPLRAVSGLVAERVDQGADYSGTGPVYAIGPGTIEETTNGGWPGGGFIVEHVDSGELAGQYVYVGEDVTPAVAVGDHVTASTVIGRMFNGGAGIETGFAAGPPNLGESYAMATGQASPANPGLPTAAGRQYAQILAALGAPPAQVNGKPVARGGGGIPLTAPGGASSPSSSANVGVGGDIIIGVLVLAGAGVAVWGMARATGANRYIKQAGQRAGQVAEVAAMA